MHSSYSSDKAGVGSEAGKPCPGQQPVSIDKELLKHGRACVFICCPWLLPSTNGRAEQVGQRPYDPEA